jgi:hypothetical protein
MLVSVVYGVGVADAALDKRWNRGIRSWLNVCDALAGSRCRRLLP